MTECASLRAKLTPHGKTMQGKDERKETIQWKPLGKWDSTEAEITRVRYEDNERGGKGTLCKQRKSE